MNKHFNPIHRFTCILLFLTMMAACKPAGSPAVSLTPVKVQLRWTHQAQFAGFYAADQEGYYKAEGLAVSLIEGGPQVDYMQPVIDGAAQFGVANADGLILARASGKPLRAVATIYRHSPAVYMTLASSGITRPQDFVGKTIEVGLTGVPNLRILMARAGIRPDQYTVVTSTPDLTPFYSGAVDVRSVFITNEVITAQAAGYKVNIISPDDYGIHYYADTIFTTDDTIAANSDLVLRFLRATLKGWTYAVENPQEIGAMVVKYNPNADTALENSKMTASLPLVNTGEDHIGWMRPELWAGMEQTLSEQGVLTTPLDVTQVYTMQFLEKIYK
jgi:NitT/TauT family transport system substrate-binding protein